MTKGLIIKSTGSWYTVKSNTNEIINCKIRGSFRTKGVKSTNPLAVGDWIDFEKVNPSDKGLDPKLTGPSKEAVIGVINELHDRKNYIVRKSTNLSRQTHVLAANIDQVFLVVTVAFPVTTCEFIDRFLVTAEAYSIPARIVFNKTDIYSPVHNKSLLKLITTYENAGYPCYVVSTEKGENINVIKEALKDKVNLFTGNSGVGKSSIINRIEPGLNLKTSEISRMHKRGRHTTTFYQMFELSFGGYVIDTPGIKGFGLIDINKNELYHFFPELFKISKQCKFYNCLHIGEPGCAVTEALKEGKISRSRYRSYLGIFNENETKYR